MKEYGLLAKKLAKELVISVFINNGFLAVNEGGDDRIDIWLQLVDSGEWIAIELSLNRKAIVGLMGLNAVHEGIVPMWLDWNKLQIAFEKGEGKGLVQELWIRTKKIIRFFSIKKFKEPHWTIS